MKILSHNCEVCGLTRSRKIGDDPSRYLCFDCYVKEHDKGFYKGKNQHFDAYQQAIKIYYLEPLYYGDKPNYEALDKAHFGIGKDPAPIQADLSKIDFNDIPF